MCLIYSIFLYFFWANDTHTQLVGLSLIQITSNLICKKGKNNFSTFCKRKKKKQLFQFVYDSAFKLVPCKPFTYAQHMYVCICICDKYIPNPF